MKNVANSVVSKELYEMADEYGVPRDRVYARITGLGWSELDAATAPLRKRDNDPLIELARSNGITAQCFRKRVERGMDPKKAATLRKEKPQKIPESWYTLAAIHGIDRNLLRIRIRVLKWSFADAIKTPIGEKPKRPKPVV